MKNVKSQISVLLEPKSKKGHYILSTMKWCCLLARLSQPSIRLFYFWGVRGVLVFLFLNNCISQNRKDRKY